MEEEAIPKVEDESPGMDFPDVNTYANVSHQKGDVPLITTTRDKFEAILSASSSLSSNFLALMIGSALTVFMALKSGGIEESWKQTFKIALIFSLVLVVFFGLLTARDEYRKYRFKQELKRTPSTPLH